MNPSPLPEGGDRKPSLQLLFLEDVQGDVELVRAELGRSWERGERGTIGPPRRLDSGDNRPYHWGLRL